MTAEACCSTQNDKLSKHMNILDAVHAYSCSYSRVACAYPASAARPCPLGIFRAEGSSSSFLE